VVDRPEFVSQLKGFILSRVLMTALEIDLFVQLEGRGMSFKDICSRLDLNREIGRVFINVLEAYGYLHLDGGKYVTTALAKSIISKYKNIKSWNEEMRVTYDSLVDFTHILRTGNYKETTLSAYWAYKKNQYPESIPPEVSKDYSLTMDASQEEIAKLLVKKIDFSKYTHMVDIGGGYGRFAIEIVNSCPKIRVTIVDLPSVCCEANRIITEKGLSDRVSTMGADFFKGPLPKDADIVAFIRTLHDWDDEDVKKLLGIARSILTGNGTILISEPMNDDNQQIDKSSALSSLMLSLMGGKRRKKSEYIDLLKSLGFNKITCTDLDFSIFKVISGQVLKR